MSTLRVFFYVQYLEGIGHVVRTVRIAQALQARGVDVIVVLGGPPVPKLIPKTLPTHQLPPFHAGPDSYSRLLKSDGTSATLADKAFRRSQLLALYDRITPHVVITETYPMGRWAMDFELDPLLERVAATGQNRPLVLASLRDILQMPKTASKVHKSVAVLEAHYDHMLVHGDPNLVRIEESFPALAKFDENTSYTGIVAPPVPEVTVQTSWCYRADVIVSAGGGAIAAKVLKAAIAAKQYSSYSNATWLALTGPRMSRQEQEQIKELGAENAVEVKTFEPNLAGLMAHAKLSIQRAGYNTVADLLRTKCKALLIPDSENHQMEQPLRAAKLANLGRAVVLSETKLSPAAMADAIDKTTDTTVRQIEFDTDGADGAASRILQLWTAHKPSQSRT